MPKVAYLAGSDVFLPGARAHAERKVAISAKFGLRGLPPMDEEAGELSALPSEEAWRVIYGKNIAAMEASDVIIANLTPFGGASADAGTLIEVGWFLGRGKPVFGYSNTRAGFSERMGDYLALTGTAGQGLLVESFGLPDNLMIAGAVWSGGYPIFLPQDDDRRGLDALDVFEACVKAAAELLAGGAE
jgi:nucleoside 2-deoxyribosyltransferase